MLERRLSGRSGGAAEGQRRGSVITLVLDCKSAQITYAEALERPGESPRSQRPAQPPGALAAAFVHVATPPKRYPRAGTCQTAILFSHGAAGLVELVPDEMLPAPPAPHIHERWCRCRSG